MSVSGYASLQDKNRLHACACMFMQVVTYIVIVCLVAGLGDCKIGLKYH